MSQTSNLILVLSSDTDLSRKAIASIEECAHSDWSFKSIPLEDLFELKLVTDPALILVDLKAEKQFLSSYISMISQHYSTSRVVCIGQPADVPQMMKLLKAGIKDFIALPFKREEIRQILDEKTPAGKTNGAGEKRQGKIVTLFSPKGGTGVTLLTTNLAVALAKNNPHKIAVCDFASQCGDVATYLNLSPQYTIRDIIDVNDIVDMSFLEGVMQQHETGVKILPAPRQDQEPLNADHLNLLKSVLSLLKESHDVIFVDGSHLDPTLLLFMMSESDLIYLVGNPDVVCLRGLISCLNKLKSHHYDEEKIKVLINRHNSKSQIDSKEFVKHAKHPISCYLPNNYSLCIDAVNTGQPINKIHEKSDLAKQIAELSSMTEETLGLNPQNASQEEKVRFAARDRKGA